MERSLFKLKSWPGRPSSGTIPAGDYAVWPGLGVGTARARVEPVGGGSAPADRQAPSMDFYYKPINFLKIMPDLEHASRVVAVRPPRTSHRSQILLPQLKSGTSPAPNTTGSLQHATSLNYTSPQNPDEYDEKGSEMRPPVMFGECENALVALMARRLREGGLGPRACLNGTVRARIDSGTTALLAHTHDTSDPGRDMLREAETR